ncbi:MAG: 50S ribosomal protein L32 [bacterium]|nr:50S ribosomal protein L32 [bacterium]
MIAPRKKISKSKGASRHSTWQGLQMKKLANRTQITKCDNCGQEKLLHRVCSHCGQYRGKQIITIKTKSQEILEA